MRRANYQIVEDDRTCNQLIIRDLGPWDQHPSVTNDAEQVVKDLHRQGYLPSYTTLRYYDSEGRLDQLLHDGQGHFTGFAPALKAEGRTS